uniref:Uncharacterized protein n=1 Tax=Meloidogyne floridensis TaxID=298350 RepID=A0A915P2N4_9BILA
MFLNTNNNENNEEEDIEKGERTDFKTLNVSDDTIIGIGDLIAYSLFIGKAAADMDGCFNLTILFTIFGVLFGLLYTLRLSEESGYENKPNYLPALPIPLTLGCGIYFLTSFVIGKFYGKNIL